MLLQFLLTKQDNNMKILKRLIIGILMLLGIVLVLAAFAPKEVNVSKTTSINASQADVFRAINELKTWEEWSPWKYHDETIKNVYSEQSAGQGAYYTWTSENSGAGQMTITDTYEMDSLKTLLEFDGQGNATADFSLKPVEDGTEVTWTFHSDMTYPFNAMLLFRDMEGMLGDYYEEGLGYLKTYVESNKTSEYKVDKIDFPATRYLVQRATVKMADMGQHFQTVMPEVAKAFLDSKVKMAGPTSGLFYTWDQETQTSDLAIGIPAAPGAEIDGLSVIDLAASSALKIDYYGPYEGTGKAHEAMETFLKNRNLLANSSLAIERYITDPTTEPNPKKWLTEVVYLISE